MDVGWPELAIIAVVVLVLFGSRKLPDAARSLGRSLRIFKAETRGLRDDENAAIESRHAQAQGSGETTAHESRLTDGTGTAPARESHADSDAR